MFATGPAAQWEQRLSEAGIPCGMVREVSEAIALGRARGTGHQTTPARAFAAGLQEHLDRQCRFQVQRRLAALDVAAAAGFGEHNEDILTSLGFDAAERREILAGNAEE